MAKVSFPSCRENFLIKCNHLQQRKKKKQEEKGGPEDFWVHGRLLGTKTALCAQRPETTSRGQCTPFEVPTGSELLPQWRWEPRCRSPLVIRRGRAPWRSGCKGVVPRGWPRGGPGLSRAYRFFNLQSPGTSSSDQYQ